MTGLPFTPLKIHMKVAGSVLKDNVIGSTTCITSFNTSNGEISLPLTFLIAHALNGYEAILGATLLLNPEVTAAITPTHLCLTTEYNNSTIQLETVQKPVQGNFMQCESVKIPPGVITNITATVNPPFQANSNETIEARTVSGDYTILECKQTSLNTVQCTVKNCSGRALTVGGSDPFGLAYPPDGHGHRASELNAQRAQRPDQEDADADADSRHSNPTSSDAEVAEESIEEQIIAEHQLFDPSDLDKKVQIHRLRNQPQSQTCD
jgi:hypothetical protein